MVVCDPKTLLAAAKCVPCLTPVQREVVKSSLLCKIAVVGLKGGGGGGAAFPAPTGFTFDPASSTAITASFAAPPAGATGTEIWTSSDGITYALDSTVPAPGTGNNVVAPAVGSFKWGKVRYVNVMAGSFSAPAEVSGRVCDWITRVVANGGVNPTLTERRAANTFDLALVSAVVDSKLVSIVLFIQSSVIGAITPLYHLKGSDPWSNQGPFVGADLSVNGLKGDGTKYLNTVITPSVDLTVNSTCWFLYESVAQSNVGELFGASGGAQLDALLPNDVNNGVATNYYSQNQLVTTPPILTGFYLGSRVSNTDQRLYFANSANAWAQVGATQAGAGAGLCAQTLTAFALNAAGTPGNKSNGALSICGVASGLTSGQGQSLFNAVDAFRIALGGGRV